ARRALALFGSHRDGGGVAARYPGVDQIAGGRPGLREAREGLLRRALDERAVERRSAGRFCAFLGHDGLQNEQTLLPGLPRRLKRRRRWRRSPPARLWAGLRPARWRARGDRCESSWHRRRSPPRNQKDRPGRWWS